MRGYRYLYFTILSLYVKFSNDPQKHIFAIGLFTLIISFGLMATANLIGFYQYGMNGISLKYTLSISGIVLIFNALYFATNEQRQLKFEEQYLSRRSSLKTVISAILLALFIFANIWVSKIIREINIENGGTGTKIENKR